MLNTTNHEMLSRKMQVILERVKSQVSPFEYLIFLLRMLRKAHVIKTSVRYTAAVGHFPCSTIRCIERKVKKIFDIEYSKYYKLQ